MEQKALFPISILLLVFSTESVLASNSSDPSSDLLNYSLEDLLNLKIRYSLKKALELKREALTVKDSIVAEDIADFVDLNLAEAIQRMPGVAITREGGEGRQISLRGVGANFTRVKINGQETLAISSSPMDSRNTQDNDRAFDFNVFAAEMFSQIDINKSYSADQSEGGIGGTVELFTPMPFDKPGLQLALNGALGDNSYTDDLGSRALVLASNTWEHLGILGSLLYTNRQTHEQGFNTVRWRAVTGRPISSHPNASNVFNDARITDPDTIALLEAGDLWFSRSNRYSVWENEQTRLGANFSVQYQFNDRAEVSLSTLYAKLDNDRDEYHLGTGSSSSRWPGVMEDLRYENVKGEREIVYAEYSNAQLRSEHRQDKVTTTYQQINLKGSWQFSEHATASASIAQSVSDFAQPTLDKVFLISKPGTIYTDFRRDRFYADIDYSIDTRQPENWQAWDVFLEEEYSRNRFNAATFDLRWEASANTKIKTGLDFLNYANKTGQANATLPITDSNSLSFSQLYRGSDDAEWIVANVAQAQAFYNVNNKLPSIPLNNIVEEDSAALYGLLQYSSTFLGKSLTSEWGARYINTEVYLSNLVNAETVVIEGDYQRLLPTFSSQLNVNKNTLLRLAASKNISRPYLFEQRIGINNFNPNTKILSLNGNPNLIMPFESNNIDASIEWYLGKTDYFAIALFNKDIHGFSDSVTRSVPYSATGLPLSWLPAGQDPNSLYQFTYLEASQGATIQGIELSAQYNLNFLKPPFNNIGVTGNITFADGHATYRNVQASGQNEKKDFPGLSKVSGNATLFFEQQDWGMRLSAAFRDKYIYNVEAGLADEDERGFHSTIYWDYSAYYQLNKKLKVTLEMGNLTNEREEQYSDSSDRAYNTTTNGRTAYIGFNFNY